MTYLTYIDIRDYVCMYMITYTNVQQRNVFASVEACWTKKLDDGWPESEKGDVTAAVNMMITK